MQMVQTYLSNNTILGVLSDSDLTENTVDSTYFARPVKLYTGLNNPLTVICIDDMQAQVDLTNLSLQLNMFEPVSLKQVLSKPAINNANISTVTITNTDLANISLGQYYIGVTVTDIYGVSTPLFINDSFGSLLEADVAMGPVVEANIGPICIEFCSTQEPVYSKLAGIKSQYITMLNQPIQGNTDFVFQGNVTSFTGNIHIMGACTSTEPSWGSPGGSMTSLSGFNISEESMGDDNGPPTTYGFSQGPGASYGDFADLAVTSYTDYTGPISVAASGCVGWLVIFLQGAGPSGIPMAWPNFAPANSVIINSELWVGNVQ